MNDNNDDEAVDLRAAIARIVAGRWWVLASVIVFAVGFAIAEIETIPIYRASTVLIPASQERNSLSSTLSSTLGQLGGIASLAGVNLASSDAATEEALAVMQSRQFTEHFINDLNLMPELFPGQWDAATQTWKADWWGHVPTPARAVKYFNRKIRTVIRDKRSNLVTLQIDWRNREEAAAWANLLAQRLNAEMRTRAIDQAAASLSYLEKELESTSVVETRDSISRLIETQVKQRMLANVTQEYAFRIVDKAMAPDSDDSIWPGKLIFFVGGPLLGLVVGIMGVLAYGYVVAD